MTNDQITGEFTAYCNRYYELTKLLSKREEHLKNLLDNAPLYCGQTSLSEVDAIISYYRTVQAAKAKAEKTFYDMKETERFILMIMRYFEIPPGTVLTGVIPGELEYELWADENDALYINKTKSLQPEADNPNVIVIKIWDEDSGKKED
ncbi:MAG: hypothetical protein JWQ63_4357 [Mucilaginibacter sp.]|nr:hypothetical protein [Mucilaginibacter sp.]